MNRDAAYPKQIDSPSTAEHYFFDNPEKREVSEFQQSGALSNLVRKPKVPPTPQDIKKENPLSDEVSTLSRYVIKDKTVKKNGAALDAWNCVGE